MASEDLKTIQRQKITCYDTDVAHYLKPGAFMDLAQEIAYVSADSLHFGYDDLQRFGLAYMDYTTGERILKDSAFWYANLIRESK